MDELRVDIVAETDPPTGSATKLRLYWRRQDALAVSLVVVREPAHPALVAGEWVILRDFLRYGMYAATGDGNVRLRPGTDADVVFELSGAAGKCSMTVPADVLRDFLDATERVVPAGRESSDEAIDRLIEELLGREP